MTSSSRSRLKTSSSASVTSGEMTAAFLRNSSRANSEALRFMIISWEGDRK